MSQAVTLLNNFIDGIEVADVDRTCRSKRSDTHFAIVPMFWMYNTCGRDAGDVCYVTQPVDAIQSLVRLRGFEENIAESQW